jgi:hypothetical protein
LYEILRNALCWSISLVIKYSIDLCNKRIPELFQSVLPIIFKLFLTSTSMLSNHARVQIDARHQFISHLIINYLIMQILYYTEYHEGNYWKRFLSLRERSPEGTPTSPGKIFFLPFYRFKWKFLLDYIQIQNIKSLGFTYEKREKKQVLGGIFCC